MTELESELRDAVDVWQARHDRLFWKVKRLEKSVRRWFDRWRWAYDPFNQYVRISAVDHILLLRKARAADEVAAEQRQPAMAKNLGGIYGQKASSSITLADGEYSIDIHYETESIAVRRRGAPWHEYMQNRLLFCLAAELDNTLRQRVDAEQCDELESNRADEWERHCRQAEYLADKAKEALLKIEDIVAAEVHRKATDCRECKLNDNCPGFDSCPELKGTHV